MQSHRDVLSNAGRDIGEGVRDLLPENDAERSGQGTVSEADLLAGQKWVDILLEEYEDAAVLTEEGVYQRRGDPEIAFLVDPLDGSSAAANGEAKFVNSVVTILEELEAVEDDRIIGKPAGAYLIELDSGAEYYCWKPDGRVEADGRVRWNEVGFGELLPDEISPRDIESISELEGGTPGIVSNYTAKDSRKDLHEWVSKPLADAGNVRASSWGGSWHSVSVGTGRNIAAFEARPTKPTEVGGDLIAECLGAYSETMKGEPQDTLEVEVTPDGPAKTYSSLTAATSELASDIRDTIHMESILEEYF